MKEIIEEYGGMMIAVLGTIAVLCVFRLVLFEPEGDFVSLITRFGNGGC